MLKKTLIAAAVVAAGALAATPLAFADTDQHKHQVSNEGNGIHEGGTFLEHNHLDHCNNSLAHDGVVYPLDAEGDCSTEADVYGQKTEQYHTND